MCCFVPKHPKSLRVGFRDECLDNLLGDACLEPRTTNGALALRGEKPPRRRVRETDRAISVSRRDVRSRRKRTSELEYSEGEMKRLETLIEPKFLNSSFSSSNLSIIVFRAYPLIEIRQLPVEQFEAAEYLSQEYPPPL